MIPIPYFRNLNTSLLSALFFIGFQVHLLSQVPAGEIPGLPSPSADEQLVPEVGSDFDDLGFGMGVLSDPVELSMVDGLDEPLERLRLRDQDTNMILEMIQLLTGK